jgi:hypothetical protein
MCALFIFINSQSKSLRKDGGCEILLDNEITTLPLRTGEVFLTHKNNRTMKESEIREKYPPHEVETQQEFEAIMERMNHEQSELNHPYIDRKAEIAKQRGLLQIQLNALKQQVHVLGVEYQDIEIKQKELNRAFHSIKHEFITINPREKFITTITKATD